MPSRSSSEAELFLESSSQSHSFRPKRCTSFERAISSLRVCIRRNRLLCAIITIVILYILQRVGILWEIYKHILPEGPSTCKYTVNFQASGSSDYSQSIAIHDSDGSIGSWRFDYKRDARNYALTAAQCDIAFPGLATDVDLAVQRRRDSGEDITKADLDSSGMPKGITRAMVFDNSLYILDDNHKGDRPPLSPQWSTLQSLNRAISSSNEPLPNIEFKLSTHDLVDPKVVMWAYSRKADWNETWLMPDFNFWSWPEAHIGSYTEVLRRFEDVETLVGPFNNKTSKLFWRGAVWTSPRTRGDLVSHTKGKPWADVADMQWSDASTVKPIEELCKYQFIAETEGVSYSGRHKYALLCNSICVAHAAEWIQHFSYLLEKSGPRQNFIEVARDYEDLEETMHYYLAHPEISARVAENSFATFKERYLTPAAEACYWRSLIKGWASVSFEPDFYGEGDGERGWRGVPFETFIVTRELKWKLCPGCVITAEEDEGR